VTTGQTDETEQDKANTIVPKQITEQYKAKAAVSAESTVEAKSDNKVQTDNGDKPQEDKNAAAEKAKLKVQTRFDIWEFQVQGSTVLSQSQIELAVMPHLGLNRSLDDVEAARKSLEQVYKSSGFPTGLVSIPEQEINEGVVRLLVTEGRIARIKISGSKYHSPRLIRHQMVSLRHGNVPYLPEVQKELEAINRASQDRRITPVLKAGRRRGTLDVELKVNDDLPLHGKLELNGRNSSATTRTRASGTISYNNLWQKQHNFSLQYQTAPEQPEQVKVLVSSYVMPMGKENDKLAFYVVDSNSNVATGANFTVVGKGKVYGARAVFLLNGTENYFHSLSFGADHKNFSESVLQQGADTGTTPITYMPFTLSYDGTTRGVSSSTHFNTAVIFSIRGLVSKQEEFDNKRPFTRDNFIYFRGDFTHTAQLGTSASLVVRISTQISDQPLISNEQFSAGGVDSVRGYFESQSLGDEGTFASLELHSKNLANSDSGHWLQQSEWLVFYDAAKLKVREALTTAQFKQPSHYTLSGAGVGYRFRAWKTFTGSLDVGVALENLGDVKKDDVRVHFNLGYEF